MRDLGDDRRHESGTGDGGPLTAAEAAVLRGLLASLPLNGQRLKAERYVRGLLSVRGRKTLRSVAAQFDGASAQQSVHHFISASPWDWTPVRHDLARHAQRALAAQAWVIGTTLIPKTGPHSVGADPQQTPLGTVNGQCTVGAWLASERAAVPVDWQLRLSARWTADPLRSRASVPEDAAADTVETCVRRAVAGLAEIRGLPRLPVVVDVPEAGGMPLVRILAAAGRPFAVRVSPSLPVRIDRWELPTYGDLLRTAGDLAESLPHLRQQVNPGDGSTTVAAVPVVASPRRREPMTLLGEWCPERRAFPRLWLTGRDPSGVAAALRLTRLTAVVERDLVEVSDRVGVRDFGGRSFPGWHRHITLASVAHLMAVSARGHRGAVTRDRSPAQERDYRPVI
ncbi:transposase [Streptomyces rubrolavendulae]|nr:transposase [Streptomyces rubrolavendulae]